MDTSWQRQPVSDSVEEVRLRIATTLRQLRTDAGRSLADVALAAGVGKSTLHAIESADANPGIETLWALARALDVPFGALLEPASPRVRVVRAHEGPRVASEDSSMCARLLAATSYGVRVEFYDLEIVPDRPREAAGHAPGTIEHVLLIDGQLHVGPTESLAILQPGDLASFPADQPHRYLVTEGAARAVLLIEYS